MILAATAVLAVFAVAEAVLRVLGLRSELPADTQYINFQQALVISPHPLYPSDSGKLISEVFYRYRPYSHWSTRYPSNPRGRFDAQNMVTYRFNNEGFRDSDFVLEKTPGVFRIALLGDSITLGEGVQIDDIFATRMERTLKSVCTSCEVMNFGVNGYGTHDEYVLLMAEVLRFRPDVVVLVYNINDVNHIEHDRFCQELQVLRKQRRLCNTRSYAVNAVSKRIWQAEVSRRTMAFYRAMYSPGSSCEQVQSLLLQARSAVEAQGGKFVVVLFPDLTAISGKTYAFSWLHQKMGRFLNEAGIPFLDLTDPLIDAGGARLKIHPADAHPNEDAHAVMASQILATLRRLACLPPEH